MTFISGENISRQCDIVYAANITDPKTGKLSRYWNSLNDLRDNDILFCKTDFIGSCANSIRSLGKKIHLITHDSDINITKDVFDSIDSDNILSWHGMNIDYSHPKLFSIPIGLANGYCDITLKMHDIVEDELFVKPEKLLYINHRVETYPEERTLPYNIFTTNDWCTVQQPYPKGVVETYYDDLRKHRFVLCPRGNGIDTHRMWETIYAGRIPIVLRSINTSFYEDYPILIVDDYRQITENMLQSQYEKISNMKFDIDKLTVEWWLNKIKESYYEQTQGTLL